MSDRQRQRGTEKSVDTSRDTVDRETRSLYVYVSTYTYMLQVCIYVLYTFHIVWRHFSPEMHKNFHSGAASRASSPWISRQHWWWASMWAADKASQVCWIWPRFCSGRSFSVFNRPSASQRALHRSHLSDSFFFVILWIQALVGNVCEFACNILLWSCDLTEVNFIHSPNNSLPSPSRRNQSAVNVDVIGPFCCSSMSRLHWFSPAFWIRGLLREGLSRFPSCLCLPVDPVLIPRCLLLP
jgi:hypothetical protein